ncbi:MAG: ribonuclease, partial [Eubacteriaceae bacterium]|nr:ribonuclease [Eubacteriaceae bacterium]
AVGLCIKCQAATVLHTGDFKIDYHPIGGEIIDLQRFAKIGSQGVDLLMSDSTNVEGEGFTQSESTVGPTLFRPQYGECDRSSQGSGLFKYTE